MFEGIENKKKESGNIIPNRKTSYSIRDFFYTGKKKKLQLLKELLGADGEKQETEVHSPAQKWAHSASKKSYAFARASEVSAGVCVCVGVGLGVQLYNLIDQ